MIHLESRCLNVPIDALPSNKNWFCESLATQKRGIQTMCCTPQTASRFTIGVQHPPPLDHIERSWMKLSKNLATTSLYYTVDFFRLQKSNLPVDHVLPWNETTPLWTHMLIVLSKGCICRTMSTWRTWQRVTNDRTWATGDFLVPCLKCISYNYTTGAGSTTVTVCDAFEPWDYWSVYCR